MRRENKIISFSSKLLFQYIYPFENIQFLEPFQVHRRIERKVQIFPIYLLPPTPEQPLPLSTSLTRVVHLSQLRNLHCHITITKVDSLPKGSLLELCITYAFLEPHYFANSCKLLLLYFIYSCPNSDFYNVRMKRSAMFTIVLNNIKVRVSVCDTDTLSTILSFCTSFT